MRILFGETNQFQESYETRRYTEWANCIAVNVTAGGWRFWAIRNNQCA